ncbi:MAG: hypothetical protein A3A94_02905 [Candidatus Portnoybacteria bacterium RIFCSPLOWO2_01_FULL_43_11]|uniref:Uncharacterized protein n=3 Tax=Candidatus Portnoyibacteriota TaxID=1817913 RepID=A0A1G2FAN9_9BACT|nr:MAG: hypothetical protein A2815_00980 [Candidatus Portnoybacteria bacterium RIFCSPHIGHO2_01_FULL_40_12b]OGZ36381.1 MAG: hypothetical protein A3D38_00820 [Candidatus Portnoybacteria bacterium RIFCSPHIGHO2_02_FULL_40_23]OGZ38512.1 MAG: hypothetical protein A3A94_02905 [Candidatus Portnoybacteria bacterium RIFCSPLOWO2_01_FULL_43_11]OGZ40217.1 MAG: hypothetical protein A3I20_03270 [Candidatus Portnoybacteria bacterium RIFCSPLOWO2_02_FULL_40_15]
MKWLIMGYLIVGFFLSFIVAKEYCQDFERGSRIQINNKLKKSLFLSLLTVFWLFALLVGAIMIIFKKA